MLNHHDLKELLSVLAKYQVKYLIIGGYAVMKYTEPRWTKDIDLLIATDAENASAVFHALQDFGAPLAGLTEKDFEDTSSYYQMGNPPMRVDIFMAIPGVEFEAAWNKRTDADIAGIPVHFLSREDLISSKLATARAQDLLDVENLKKFSPES